LEARLIAGLAAVSLLLAGCTPTTPARGQGSTPSGGTREPDCTRQFDDVGAGFQTCDEGETSESE
jgi:hypothetical protein